MSQERAGSPEPCPACEGAGGGGDDRCAIVLCEACDGTGLAPLAGGR